MHGASRFGDRFGQNRELDLCSIYSCLLVMEEQISLEERIKHLTDAISELLQLVPRNDQVNVLRAAFVQAGPSDPTEIQDPKRLYDEMVLESLGLEQEVITKEGGLISTRDFAERLGLRSEETVRNYYRQGRIIGLRRGGRNLGFPAWQIYRRGLLPGLAQIIEVLSKKEMDPLTQIIFFVYECKGLSRRAPTPLKALRLGMVDKVLMAARHLHEMGR